MSLDHRKRFPRLEGCPTSCAGRSYARREGCARSETRIGIRHFYFRVGAKCESTKKRRAEVQEALEREARARHPSTGCFRWLRASEPGLDVLLQVRIGSQSGQVPLCPIDVAIELLLLR